MSFLITLYNIGIRFYGTGIRMASFFNAKARLWTDGRRDIFTTIKNDIAALPISNEPLPKTLWMHVASLGEFEQGRPLIEALKNKTPQYKIILTFFSPSGYEIRKKYPLADHVFYLPMDTPQNARQFLDIIQPDLVVFVKYEFWYHYLNELKNKRIPTILISGIFNKKQLSVFNPYAYLLKKMLLCFTRIFVQTPPSVSLLQEAGFCQVHLAGDTRVDRVIGIAKEAKTYPSIEKFVGNAPVLICGSTWQEDEEMIVQLFNNKYFTHYKFIIAPHDISLKNIERLEKILPEKYIKYSTESDEKGKESNITKAAETDIRILIIDNIGMLSSIYRYGKTAYIGGGFGKGIHNTLEPIAFGLPVIFGKQYKKFEEAIRLIETGGGFSIADFKSLEEKMLFLKDEKNYLHASKAALDYLDNNKGATDIIMHFIEKEAYHR